MHSPLASQAGLLLLALSKWQSKNFDKGSTKICHCSYSSYKCRTDSKVNKIKIVIVSEKKPSMLACKFWPTSIGIAIKQWGSSIFHSSPGPSHVYFGAIEKGSLDLTFI